ncbi:Aldehyde/histidinol dehydrogenase [Mrakia frigida]|uniref:1-pyrroline-5-carboxylate dehydrogenase n=1 Tax=Mrakia frigida TaxID=29902 RepID=UPI003FCBF1C2
MAATLASFKIPTITNEPMGNYPAGSAERKGLEAALAEMKASMPFEVPCVVDGKPVKTGVLLPQLTPHSHSTAPLCNYHSATPEVVASAIESSLKAQKEWENMPWNDRAAIFLKAADLTAGKYRYKLMAATMLGQGKNTWQAEIDAAAEMADFFRFSVKFVEQLYTQQPSENSPGVWNRTEFRPLEGFVLAVTPFNFTAIGGNLVGAPAIVGNVVLWKPSPMATYANYLTHKILLEAGVPPSVIQFIPGPAPEVVKQCIDHKAFAGLHFTGSTAVFKGLWKQISQNVDLYRSYPRIVGETGGKNFHMIHKSADIRETVLQSIRSGFEYSGQKCSALGRIYVAKSLWDAGWGDVMKEEVERIKVGSCEDWTNFLGPVINQASFDKITGLIAKAKAEGGEILVGGNSDSSVGYFVDPTVIVTKDPKSVTMVNEIFGPVLTVFVYEDDDFEKTCELIDETTDYALTGSVFANDRSAVVLAQQKLRNAAGNFYINDKCTGAVVGQQPFGGARGSGTNDKSGSISIFYRFVSARSIKESFVGPSDFLYPSNFQ